MCVTVLHGVCVCGRSASDDPTTSSIAIAALTTWSTTNRKSVGMVRSMWQAGGILHANRSRVTTNVGLGLHAAIRGVWITKIARVKTQNLLKICRKGCHMFWPPVSAVLTLFFNQLRYINYLVLVQSRPIMSTQMCIDLHKWSNSATCCVLCSSGRAFYISWSKCYLPVSVYLSVWMLTRMAQIVTTARRRLVILHAQTY